VEADVNDAGRRLLRAAFRRPVVRSAVQVSLVVGTVLNLVNGRDALLGDGPVAWGNVALNYLVPYCVASYSAARNETRRRPGGEREDP
jgi:hypothetical protein